MCLTQADLLRLNLTRIAGHETCSAQSWTQLFIVIHQRTGNTVANGTCLCRATTTLDRNVDIELASGFSQLQRLAHYHASGNTTKILLELTIINHDFAGSRLEEDAGG